jgi:hypothetical protein
MATAQPAGDERSVPDTRFRSARKRVLWTSLALGIFVLLAGTRTMLTIAILSLVFALVQIASPFYAALPSSFFLPR